jgi:hypothetical protein
VFTQNWRILVSKDNRYAHQETILPHPDSQDPSFDNPPNTDPGLSKADISRLNGAKSKGPITPEGKAKSSQNALKHGFRSMKTMVIDTDRQEEFDQFYDEMIEDLNPIGITQTKLAEQAVINFWKLQQVNEVQTDLLRDSAELSNSLHEAFFFFSRLKWDTADRLKTLSRYELEHDRAIHRSLKTLLQLKKEARLEVTTGRKNTKEPRPARPTVAKLAESSVPVLTASETQPAAYAPQIPMSNEPQTPLQEITPEAIKTPFLAINQKPPATDGEPGSEPSESPSADCQLPTPDTNEPSNIEDSNAHEVPIPEPHATHLLEGGIKPKKRIKPKSCPVANPVEAKQPGKPDEPASQPKPHWGADYAMRAAFSIAP